MNNLIRSFLINWNNFPIDYWWRKKHNVAFGSQQHREMSWIDMAIEYREDIEITKMLNDRDDEEDKYQNSMLGLKSGSEVVKMSAEEIDDCYNNLDLSKF